MRPGLLALAVVNWIAVLVLLDQPVLSAGVCLLLALNAFAGTCLGLAGLGVKR